MLPLSACRALVLRDPLRTLRSSVDINRLLLNPFPVKRRSWTQWQRNWPTPIRFSGLDTRRFGGGRANGRRGGRRTLVIGSPAKEMRFRPQRQTDSVVISVVGNGEEWSCWPVCTNSKDSLKLGGLLRKEISRVRNQRDFRFRNGWRKIWKTCVLISGYYTKLGVRMLRLRWRYHNESGSCTCLSTRIWALRSVIMLNNPSSMHMYQMT